MNKNNKNAEKAAAKFLTGASAIFFAVFTACIGVSCSIIEFIVRPDEISNAAAFIQSLQGILVACGSSAVMTKYYCYGKVFGVIPVRKERAAEICLARCNIISSVPFVANIIILLDFTVIGKITIMETLAVTGVSLLSTIIVFYATTFYFPRFSAPTDSSRRLGLGYMLFIWVPMLVVGLGGTAVLAILKSGEYSTGCVMFTIAILLIIPYMRFAKYSVKKAVAHREKYYI